ncbi:two-component sensor histidine kinase [Erythrobacteraceae bacterium CFH 75059]|uniref:sensor histidine kinase n=1 Tax=Qipengyuania thermophila TaxID=2509361 RepID=UPI00101EA545|nr:ATP-binding protein [Qipengyuania thermophila]TCD05104.1 two-component sensor histidine kinase [Erythrobacteraceae bacterium CFH 75059]
MRDSLKASWVGLAFAAVATLALVLNGLSPAIAAVILLVWAGSIWISVARPPRAVEAVKADPFTRGNLGAILELSSSPIILTDGGVVVIANSAARDVVGAHIIGQDARVAFRNPAAIELLKDRSGGSVQIRNFRRLRDFWLLRRQIIDDRLAIIELTDRTAEVTAMQAQTDFVANASHELRTPLASILGYVETLRDSGGDLPPETVEKFLSIIEREAKRLQELVSDLISLSRIEAEKHDLPETSVALAAVVRRAALEAAGDEHRHRLDFALDESVTAYADEQQLEQVVRNLVANAFAYGSDTEPVRVTLTRIGDSHARLQVVDRGVGIAKEHLPHLTRRFYRTDPGRSRRSGGTGLGLAIVKHIVERHRGRLDISSTVGSGTRVVVRLPLSPRPAGATSVNTQAAEITPAGA